MRRRKESRQGRRLLAAAIVTMTAGSLTTVATPASAATTWLQVSAGYGYTCGVTSARDLWCWGNNSSGQLGTGDTTQRLVPTRIGAKGIWASVSAGQDHTCALDHDGVRYCWGRNVSGQLGLGDTTRRTQPTSGSSIDSPDTTWKMISTGKNHTCGIRTNGGAYCWGSDFYGQLGNSGTMNDDQPTPRHVVSYAISTISTGTVTTCGLSSQGGRYCWGHNDPTYKLGLGKNAATLIPTPTPLASSGDWQSINLGTYHGCTIYKDRRLYCWGENGYGEVGVGDKKSRYSPTLVSGGGGWTQVSVGANHTCGLKTNDIGYCWGSNKDGQLGVGTLILSTVTTPRVIDNILSNIRPGIPNKPPMTWSSLSAGRDHTCGIRTDGILFCWGGNSLGELGDGTTTDRLSPREVA